MDDIPASIDEKYRPRIIPRKSGSDELFLRTGDALEFCEDVHAIGLAAAGMEAFIWQDEKLYVPPGWVMAFDAVEAESWHEFRDRATSEMKALIMHLADRGANTFCIEPMDEEDWAEELEEVKRRRRRL